MSDEATHLIKQAKEEARKENIKKFLKEKSKLISAIVGAFLLVILITIIVSMRNSAKRAEFSEMLHQTLIDQQIGDIKKSKTGLKAIYENKSAPAGVKSLASLRYAALLLNEGKKAEAIAIYDEVNQCRSCNLYVRDVAGLLEIKILMSDDQEAAKIDLLAKIKKIEKSAQPLKNYLSEQRALFEMKNGNLEEAYRLFDLIAQNPSKVAAALKERAENRLKMIIAKGFSPKANDKTAKK